MTSHYARFFGDDLRTVVMVRRAEDHAEDADTTAAASMSGQPRGPQRVTPPS